MLSFQATNIEKAQYNRFPPAQANAASSLRMEERNYLDFPPIYKQQTFQNYQNKSQQNPESSNFEQTNNSYYKKLLENPCSQTSSEQNTSNFKCSHLSNWRLQREFQFANKSKQASQNASHLGKILDQKQFQNQRHNSQIEYKNSENYIPRSHMKVTNPLLRLDKDFKEQPLIKNVISVSDDAPNWYQNSKEFYTIDHFDSSKKSKQKAAEKADIFGNKIQKYENNFQFQCMQPMQSQRTELNKMIIADKSAIKEMRNLSKEDLKRGKCKLNWVENVPKQKFDHPFPCEKIGKSENPFYKHLEVKKNSTQLFGKIGEQQSNLKQKINKDDQVLLKIGHGIPQTINPLKY